MGDGGWGMEDNFLRYGAIFDPPSPILYSLGYSSGLTTNL